MAISHTQPLLLLFVSLFFLPAALGTAVEVYNCSDYNLNYVYVVNVTKVEIIPYPLTFQDATTFKITGVTSINLTDKVLDLEFRSKRHILDRFRSYRFCDVTKCPIEPGPFVLNITNIDGVRGDDYLSGEYNVSFVVRYPSYPHNGTLIEVCGRFNYHANALAEFENSPFTNGVNVDRVEIFPYNATVNDNPVFRITADTPISIESSTTVSASMFLEGESQLLWTSRRGYELCDCTKHCLVERGSFELAFPHPYWQYNIKAGRYRVQVVMINQNFPFHVSMNLFFWVPIREA